MAHLAIKGHTTRGKEVIEILEMLGGINTHTNSADSDSLCFYIGKNTNIIYYDHVNNCYEDEDTLVFTLEEFLKKFPYKVGDKVSIVCDNNDVFTIKSMMWDTDLESVAYFIESIDGIEDNYSWLANELEPYLEQKEKPMENKGTLVEIDLTREEHKAEEIEVILGDYEFVLKKGKTYFVKKKPQYPKTYEECCEIKHSDPNFYIDTHLYSNQLEALYRLLICKDAYWKIAGEQMGLGEPWKPDWNHDTVKYVIFPYQYLYSIDKENYRNTILAFPTEEMRDVFYENFKYLIEQCKDFL
jgi:hypothetical protein